MDRYPHGDHGCREGVLTRGRKSVLSQCGSIDHNNACTGGNVTSFLSISSFLRYPYLTPFFCFSFILLPFSKHDRPLPLSKQRSLRIPHALRRLVFLLRQRTIRPVHVVQRCPGCVRRAVSSILQDRRLRIEIAKLCRPCPYTHSTVVTPSSEHEGIRSCWVPCYAGQVTTECLGTDVM